jgi:hypothetical protein
MKPLKVIVVTRRLLWQKGTNNTAFFWKIALGEGGVRPIITAKRLSQKLKALTARKLQESFIVGFGAGYCEAIRDMQATECFKDGVQLITDTDEHCVHLEP